MSDNPTSPESSTSIPGASTSTPTSTPTVSTSSIPKKRRSFTIEQKLEVIQFAKISSRNAASRKFNIARHCVSQWMRNEKDLEELIASTLEESPSKKRRPGAGRHIRNEGLDDQVAEWIRSELAANRLVSRSQIQEKALRIYEDNKSIGSKEFKASTGWLEKFLIRHNFKSTRERGVSGIAICSTSDQQKPSTSSQTNFISFIQQTRTDNNYNYIYIAYKTLSASIGSETLQVTVILTTRSDGYKLLPYIILPAEHENASAASTFDGKLHLLWSDKVDLDEKSVADYLNRIFANEAEGKRLLLWNKFGYQIDDDLKQLLLNLRVDNTLISSGYNTILKTFDFIFKDMFNSKLLDAHRHWCTHGENATTSNGNLGPLATNLFLNWIVRAWNSIIPKSIAKIFGDESNIKTNCLSGYVSSSNLSLMDFGEQVQNITDNDFLGDIIEEVNQEMADNDSLSNFIRESTSANSP